MLPRLLLLARPPASRSRLRRILEVGGAVVTEAETADSFWSRLGTESFDLIVARLADLPEPAATTVSQIRQLPDRPEVIVLTDREDAEGRGALQAAGCLGVVSESLLDSSLESVLTTLVDRQHEAAAGPVGGERRTSRPGLHDFASRSPMMQDLLRLARKVVSADTSLLLLGETGVGKEWLARAIHSEGPRSQGPFIAVNCAAMPEALLESELFGHEKGSFTGALRARRGHFELAHRGTLFLDEIGDLSFHLQAKLLRALQERTIQRIGSEKALPVDVRLMAATNQDLEQAIDERRFRRDLFYRLSVMTLVVPPLRERREDIAPLVETYFRRFRAQLGRSDIEGLSSEVMRALEAYLWPGNVRELINVLERAILLCEGTLVTLDDLPEGVTASSVPPPEPRLGAAAPRDTEPEPAGDEPLAVARTRVLRKFEVAYLTRLLRRTHGGVAETAHLAGIDPRTLYNKMKAYGLRKESFRATRRQAGRRG
jgi:DNA-binding NtrC family response regulator